MPADAMGFVGIGPEQGIFVEADVAYDYALNRCLRGTKAEQEEFKEEFKDRLVEWYYSGNWIKEE